MNSKPLLGPCDSYQLEPFEYEWAWLMTHAQEQNNWQPAEIPVASDVFDYKDPTLDPKHKHLFESVMAQLTTFDIERGDDAAETFLSIFQPAEIRQFLKRLVYEEALHTKSYRYVIENLGVPLSIYDRWREVPSMKARVEMAQQMSRPIEKIVGAHLLNETPYHEISLIDKQDLLRSLIFWSLVFEGVQFWMSLLGPIQQLSRLNRFKGAAEQFVFIARDEQAHIGFGIALINTFIAQHPECVTEGFISVIEEDTRKAMALEGEYISYCLKDGPILGYSANDHLATAKFFANMRMAQIGFPQFFSEAYHAYQWMSEQMELRKEVSFFEKRVSEYQVGSITFDEDTEGKDHEGWADPLEGAR
jgi:ribonucleoside-diphosphate reductase beta chain